MGNEKQQCIHAYIISGVPTAPVCPQRSTTAFVRPQRSANRCRARAFTAVHLPLLCAHSGPPTAPVCLQRSTNRFRAFTAAHQPLLHVCSGSPTAFAARSGPPTAPVCSQRSICRLHVSSAVHRPHANATVPLPFGCVASAVPLPLVVFAFVCYRLCFNSHLGSGVDRAI